MEYPAVKRKRMNTLKTIFSGISLFFAGIWLVIRIVLEYFGFISDGNDRTTGIKDLRDEYRKANYR
ncbi:hypothetical protein CR163_000880 [Prosthecochloris sp. ZM_2]|nr:hypothetical protein CR163_000880 [Prosthecochloris sp. ZM_2]